MQDQCSPAPGFCQCGCGQPVKRRFVPGHNIRVNNPRKAGTLEVRDMGYETPCHLWPGYVGRQGYARTRRDGNRQAQQVHRIYYEAKYGPVPPGFDLHHRCEIPWCANPDHLEQIPHDEHARHHGRVAAPRDALGRWVVMPPLQDHPHACTDGYIYLGYTAVDEETGEEVERVEALPCRRCANETGL